MENGRWSQELKAKSHARESAADTGITSMFIGPRVVVTHGNLSADVGFELPVLLNNTALQTVPTTASAQA